MTQISSHTIQEAHNRIRPFVHHTPVYQSQGLNRLSGARLYFKCENLQKVGAFKARGAFNFALQLSDKERLNGICTHSSGNHAQAVALAARTLHIQAHIVMPENAPEVKVAAVRSYGADITFCEPTLLARETTLAQIQQKTGAYFIPPYDHEYIVAGQASAAKELLEEHPLDALITPVGGGGLLAGSALSAFYFGKGIPTYGAEPEGADDAKRSFDSGQLIPSTHPTTIADGLLTSLGELNFAIIQDRVQDILLVNDNEIKQAMLLIWERLKLVVEPSAAVPLAAILRYPEYFSGKAVGLILSGGNLDLRKWSFN